MRATHHISHERVWHMIVVTVCHIIVVTVWHMIVVTMCHITGVCRLLRLPVTCLSGCDWPRLQCPVSAPHNPAPSAEDWGWHRSVTQASSLSLSLTFYIKLIIMLVYSILYHMNINFGLQSIISQIKISVHCSSVLRRHLGVRRDEIRNVAIF